MKCPKCSYIGFENTDRCRNCGYDFALASSAPPEPDLPLRGGPAGPYGDFDLGGGSPTPSSDRSPRRRYDADFDPRLTPASRGAAGDLPLFGNEPGDDLPIVPAAPPTPIAVRRSTPPARSRPRPTPRAVAPAAETTLPLVEEAPTPGGEESAAAPAVADALGPRVLAGVVDWLILLALDGIVVYFTLKICRLAPADVLRLPIVPLAVFLVLLNAGYLAMLTALGGQTLGKMAFNLKVVSAADRPVTVGQAILRTCAFIVSALPAGLGLLAVLGRERRGLHDRVAGTKVMRLSIPGSVPGSVPR